jgi:hypothetical protein
MRYLALVSDKALQHGSTTLQKSTLDSPPAINPPIAYPGAHRTIETLPSIVLAKRPLGRPAKRPGQLGIDFEPVCACALRDIDRTIEGFYKLDYLEQPDMSYNLSGGGRRQHSMRSCSF